MKSKFVNIVRKFNKSLQDRDFYSDRRLQAGLVVVLFAVVGSLLLLATHAATPSVQVEPENGSVLAPATVGTDPGSSGGKYIQFGTSTGSGGSGGGGTTASAANPCVHSAAPTQWKHVILIMFENEVSSKVIGDAAAPYITSLADKCAFVQGWHDGDYRVDGTKDGTYDSKPSYATLTSGVSPSVSGITTDNYSQTSNADNIFHRLDQMGLNTYSYQSGAAHQCDSSNFSGAYHDAMRYYTDLGGQSSSPTTYCNIHDISISDLVPDMNSGKLPAFSLVLPTNDQNMHNNGIASGDAYAKTLIDPMLDSAAYKSGDTAIFFLWDEDTPIPNVLMAPSIKPGDRPTAPAGTLYSHFSFTRTTEEMLGVPKPWLGVTDQAPSLLSVFNGTD